MNRAVAAVVSAGGLLAGVVTVAVLVTMPAHRVTALASVSAMATLAQILGALGLLGAGVLACVTQARIRTGVALLVAGVAFCAPVWVGWEGGPPLVRGLGAVLAPLLLPALLDLASQPSGGGRRPVVLAGVATGYLLTTAYSVGRALVADPFLDPFCWANCSAAPFLVEASPELVDRLDAGWVGLAILLGLGAVVAGVGSVIGWRGHDTRPQAAVGAAAAACAAVELLRTVLVWLEPADPTRSGVQRLFVLLGVGLCLLAAAAAWQVWRPRAQRLALARFSREVAAAASLPSVEAALRGVLGDQNLRLGYWVPAADGYVDAAGERLPGPAEGDAILVARHGRPVAALHGPTATRTALEEALRPAVRLALENERLAAEARFHLARVAESRSRIVETADSARRSLERDLHDGAQQRLLAVLYRLRLAAEEEARAGGGPGDRTRGDLAEAVIEAGAALAELRDIAHGVFPATLESTGLAAALATLVERSGVPVRLEVAPAGRLPAAVERAAYWTVAAALAHAPAGVAQRVEVRRRGREGGGALTVRLRPVPALSLTAVSDRVGAIGGTVDLTDDAVEVVIPCG